MKLSFFLLFISTYSFGAILVAGVIGFITGMFVKMGDIARLKRRILSLENEMLSNHSTILSLEKKLSESKKG